MNLRTFTLCTVLLCVVLPRVFSAGFGLSDIISGLSKILDGGSRNSNENKGGILGLPIIDPNDEEPLQPVPTTTTLELIDLESANLSIVESGVGEPTSISAMPSFQPEPTPTQTTVNSADGSASSGSASKSRRTKVKSKNSPTEMNTSSNDKGPTPSTNEENQSSELSTAGSHTQDTSTANSSDSENIEAEKTDDSAMHTVFETDLVVVTSSRLPLSVLSGQPVYIPNLAGMVSPPNIVTFVAWILVVCSFPLS